MSVRISQETFHGAVVENMKEFDMGKEEALADAIEQFKQQGVDLSNLDVSGGAITEDGTIVESAVTKHPMVQAVDALRAALGSGEASSLTDGGVKAVCEGVISHCAGATDGRSVFGEAGGLDVLGHIALRLMPEEDAAPTLTALFDAVRCVCTRHDENRKRVTQEFFSALLTTLHKEAVGDAGLALLKAGLAVAAVVCLKQEKYKRVLVKGDITPRIVTILRSHGTHPALLTETVNVIKIITKDDDAAATLSKAFDNSRELVAAGAVPVIMSLLSVYKDDPAVVPTILTAVKVLACDDKTCQEITSEGGVGSILGIARSHMGDEEAAAAAMALLKTLAHADANKRLLCEPAVGGAGVVLHALGAHAASSKVLEHALAAVAVICLRQPENCSSLAAAGVFPLIAQAMRLHPEAIGVQRHACLALRNLVARSPELRPTALEEDFDSLLRNVRIYHNFAADVASAALRDLGLPYCSADGGDVERDVMTK